jgi:hypothetical protein
MGALSKFVGLFVDVEGVREENAKFKARMEDINAKAVVQKAERIAAHAANKQAFEDTIAQATADRKRKIEESKVTGKVVWR